MTLKALKRICWISAKVILVAAVVLYTSVLHLGVIGFARTSPLSSFTEAVVSYGLYAGIASLACYIAASFVPRIWFVWCIIYILPHILIMITLPTDDRRVLAVGIVTSGLAGLVSSWRASTHAIKSPSNLELKRRQQGVATLTSPRPQGHIPSSILRWFLHIANFIFLTLVVLFSSFIFLGHIQLLPDALLHSVITAIVELAILTGIASFICYFATERMPQAWFLWSIVYILPHVTLAIFLPASERIGTIVGIVISGAAGFVVSWKTRQRILAQKAA